MSHLNPAMPLLAPELARAHSPANLPTPPALLRNAAVEKLLNGNYSEGLALCKAEFDSGPGGKEWLNDLTVEAMELDDLTLAGYLARVMAERQAGSEWWPPHADAASLPAIQAQLTVPKLRHDADQLHFLRQAGVLDGSFDEIIEDISNTAVHLSSLGDNVRLPLTAAYPTGLRRAYGRIVHVAEAPRLASALSNLWNREVVEEEYRRARPGVVIVDNFLTDEALAAIRKFCLESTVWTRNRYADGRLGALFFGGFNCPLLLQIAEDLRTQLPEIIGRRHPLRQLWGFKNTCHLPAHSTVHADFAAVNVNFWITPASANLDVSSGGMIIYDLEAPLSWDFQTYNERSDVIHEFLALHSPKVFRVPYCHNRAIIFNSDLFHATEAVNFSPEYTNHRINITMLYGERSRDHLAPTRERCQDGGTFFS